MLSWLRRLLFGPALRPAAERSEPITDLCPYPPSPPMALLQEAPSKSSVAGTSTPAPPTIARLLNQKLLFIDTETTGLTSQDRIVSLGAIIIRNVVVNDSKDVALSLGLLHLIFDPGRKSHPEAERVHGYDDWTLRHQESFGEHIDVVEQLLREADLIVGHNILFDIEFLRREFDLIGRTFPDKPTFCTMRAARQSGRFSRSGLSFLAAQLGYARASQHSAIEDSALSMALYFDFVLHQKATPIAEITEKRVMNFIVPPPRPDVLPRRKRRKRILAPD